MEKLVIFGNKEIAQIAHFYLTRDSDYKIEAFTADAEYIKEDTFCDLPVVPFEQVTEIYPPDEFKMFIAVSYAQLNKVRALKFEQAKERGYKLISYVSSKVSGWGDTKIGENCFILEDNTLQPFVRIGDNTTIWSGNHIGHHATIGNHCFITSHVVISGGVVIDDYSFVGVNATLRDHIRIGKGCLIGAAAIVLHDVEDDGLLKTVGTERAKVPASKIRI